MDSETNRLIVLSRKRVSKTTEIVYYHGVKYRRISVDDHMIRWEYDASFAYMAMDKAVELETAYGESYANVSTAPTL